MAVRRIVEVSDYADPSLRWYRTLSQAGVHFRDGVFVAEGEKVVPRLLDRPLEIVSLLLSPRWYQRLEARIEARSEPVDIYLIEKPGMEELTGRSCYQPIKAVARIPRNLSVEQLLANRKSPALYVAIEGLSNADNVGALVRSCVAFGADGILVSACASSPYLRRAVHASMGTVFSIPVVDACALPTSLRRLRDEAVYCLAAHPSADGTTLARTELPDDVCVVFGSEGDGLSDAVLDCCDGAAAIPMAAGVDSLNVASSSAVFLYEIQRRWQRM